MSRGSELSRHWLLEPDVDFLNHGSFGACPRPVLEAQRRWRERIEAQPVRFFVREHEAHLDAARAAVADFVHCDAHDLAFVPNATTGVNTVLRSLHFEPGDEILATDQTYAACKNALDAVAAAAGARVVVAHVPFPVAHPDDVVAAIDRVAVEKRTRLALLDSVSSPTGMVLPIARLAAAMAAKRIPVLVDGAHAPGQCEVDLRELGVDYYAANCHKWLCTPKGAGFLWVRRDLQERIHPLVTSHGATARRADRSRFLLEFDWTGTSDPSPYLCVPEAMAVLAGMVPGGWPEIRRRNRDLALAGRRALCAALGIEPPCPESMVGSMAAVPLPDGDPTPRASAFHTDPLQDALWSLHRIEVPVFPWPAAPQRLLRISAQLYNAPAQYERLAAALSGLLERH